MTAQPDSPATTSGLTDRRVAFFAFAAGIVGLVCVIALGLFYAREADTAGRRPFGQISHLTAAEFNLLILPVLWRFALLLESPLWWPVVLLASLAGTLGSTLLLFDAIDFAVAAALSIFAIVVQALWLILANRLLRRIDGYPRELGALAIAAGAALLGGMAIIAIGFLLQPGVENPFWTLGVAVGLLGWVSMPIWFLLAGVSLRGGVVPGA